MSGITEPGFAAPDLPSTVRLVNPDGDPMQIRTRSSRKGEAPEDREVRVKWDPRKGWVVDTTCAEWEKINGQWSLKMKEKKSDSMRGEVRRLRTELKELASRVEDLEKFRGQFDG